MSIKEITLLSLLTTILFVQEQILLFVPNVQLTVFLIVLYTRLLTFKQVSIIVFIYVLLDNLVMGSLSLMYTPAMLIAWMLIPVFLNTILKKLESDVSLALFGFLFGIIYGLILMVGTIIVTRVPVIPYLLADLPFQAIMAFTNLLTILYLYRPLHQFLETKIRRYGIRQS
ncbi:hypothetical protein [Haloplasma contractile]|nr:hypothetical protein [Haloplasma contractile]